MNTARAGSAVPSDASDRGDCDRTYTGRPPALLLVGVLALAGCKSLPLVDNEQAGTAAQTVRLDAAHGPLSRQQSAAILGEIKRKSGAENILEKHIALLQSKVDSPLVVGNKVTLLQDDAAIYRAMRQAIRAAKHHVNLETYIFSADQAGQEFSDLLLAKRGEGVQVNLIYDSFGSLATPREFFQRLKDGGVNVLEFNPVDPIQAGRRWSINHRDHRKLLLIDGRVAILGSINLYDNSSSGSQAPPRTRAGRLEPAPGWRETNIMIEGPAVAGFQQLFLDTWTRQKGPALNRGSGYFPVLGPRGHDIVLALGSNADSRDHLIYITLVSAIKSAEAYVHLTNAYFVPDPQLIEALRDAASRGVDVKLILPGKSDSWLSLHAGRSHYEDLLEHDVKIFERQGAIMHSKTVVIDGVWSTVGSTNLDWRSFVHNDELNAVVLGRDFAQQMEAWFQADLAGSTQVLLKSWQWRSPISRLMEWGARMWQYWL